MALFHPRYFKSKLAYAAIFLVMSVAGVLWRGQESDVLIKQVHKETGCPESDIQVRWRSGKSSMVDVYVCGTHCTYYSSWFGLQYQKTQCD